MFIHTRDTTICVKAYSRGICIHISLSYDSEKRGCQGSAKTFFFFFHTLRVPPQPPCIGTLGNCLCHLHHEPPLGPQAATPHEYESLPSRLYLICAIYPLGQKGIHTLYFLQELQINHDNENNVGILE